MVCLYPSRQGGDSTIDQIVSVAIKWMKVRQSTNHCGRTAAIRWPRLHDRDIR
jgi:hypothetical protein